MLGEGCSALTIFTPLPAWSGTGLWIVGLRPLVGFQEIEAIDRSNDIQFLHQLEEEKPYIYVIAVGITHARACYAYVVCKFGFKS